jgi:protein ImuB
MTRSPHQKAGRLWLALRFPDIPAHALGLAIDSPEPVAITDKRQLIWINPAAEAAGVHLEMDVITAQLLSGCLLHERNLQSEQECLAQLAQGLYQFSPHIETYTSDHIHQAGVLLEISTCLQLFGGLNALQQQVLQFIAKQKISLVMGLAHSSAAAWLLSFNGDAASDYSDSAFINSRVIDKSDFIARLKLLPISILYDFPKQQDALEKTGFVTLDDIARQIEVQTISSFKKRFGADFADYLCELFAIEQDFQQGSLFEKPVSYFKPTEFFSEELQFDYPLHQIDQLQNPMETLLQKLAAYLRKRQLQTQHIEWQLADIYHNRNELHVHSDLPQSHWRLLFDLSLIQLENRDLPFEVDSLALICRDTQPVHARSHELNFDSARKINRQDFSMTAAKLRARLGDAAVYKLSYKDGYLPAETNQRIALTANCQQDLPAVHQGAQRPAWLLDAPAAVEVRKQGLFWRGKITLIAGPECIQGQWWSEPSARDYFIGLRQDQQRLWLFWDLHKQQWFVQGIFA